MATSLDRARLRNNLYMIPNIDYNSAQDMAWLNAYIAWYLSDDEADDEDDDSLY